MTGRPLIATHLWFNDNAELAVGFYVSLIPDSRITEVLRNGPAGPGPAGSVLGLSFELAGQQYMALNGGPAFVLTPAVSLVISCETQAELDEYWARLLAAGGEPMQCGWIKDPYGLSWQVVPRDLRRLLGDADPARSSRVMRVMMGQVKLDLAALQRAYDG